MRVGLRVPLPLLQVVRQHEGQGIPRRQGVRTPWTVDIPSRAPVETRTFGICREIESETRALN